MKEASNVLTIQQRGISDKNPHKQIYANNNGDMITVFSKSVQSLNSLYISVPHYLLAGENLVIKRLKPNFAVRWDRELKNPTS
jgi:hypothetical protein